MLEQLARDVGASYLSDLTQPLLRPMLYHCLQELDPGRYPAATWQDSYHYLTGECCPPQLQQAEQIRAALLAVLEQDPA